MDFYAKNYFSMEFLLTNLAGGLIFNTKNDILKLKSQNDILILASTLHSLHYKNLNSAVEGKIKTTFFTYENLKITVFSTANGNFIFLGSSEFSYDKFYKIYSIFIFYVLLNPYYNENKIVKNKSFILKLNLILKK